VQCVQLFQRLGGTIATAAEHVTLNQLSVSSLKCSNTDLILN